MAPNSKSSSQTLKQGTLSFASAKRSAQATAGGKSNVLKASAPAPARPLATVQKVRNTRSSSTGSTISIDSSSSSNDEDIIMLSHGSTASVQRAVKRLRTSGGSAKGVSKVKQSADDSSSDEDEPQTPRTSLDDVAKTSGVQRLYTEAKDKMGNMAPIHAEKQTKIHHVLRVFDMSYEYGPCVGMTRLQRWQRAHAMGLNPPAEVLEILKTEEATKDDEYKQSVFYDDL